MPFPTTDTDLIAKGYTLEGRAKCKGPNCGKEIEWWRTPKGKRIPLDPGTMEPHWATCPDAQVFR